MKNMLTTMLLLFIPTIGTAQSVEYGSPSELKGVKKVFVDTGLDMDARKEILKELEKTQKKTPDLEIVSRADDAEVVLAYGSATETYLASVQTSPSGAGSVSSPTYRRETTGGGIVFKPLGSTRLRLLLSFKDTRRLRFERRPTTNFAREFIHAYMDANDIKR